MKIEYRVQQVLHLVRIVRGQALILISAGCPRLNAAGSYSAQRDQKLRRDGCDGVERAIVVPDIFCLYPICASMRGCSVSFSLFELNVSRIKMLNFVAIWGMKGMKRILYGMYIWSLGCGFAQTRRFHQVLHESFNILISFFGASRRHIDCSFDSWMDGGIQQSGC